MTTTIKSPNLFSEPFVKEPEPFVKKPEPENRLVTVNRTRSMPLRISRRFLLISVPCLREIRRSLHGWLRFFLLHTVGKFGTGLGPSRSYDLAIAGNSQTGDWEN